MTRPESDLEEWDPAAMVARLRTKRELVPTEPEARPDTPAIWHQAMRALGVPLRATRVLSGVVVTTEAMAAAHEWLQGPEWCLVLSATKGVGKTVAAAAWMGTIARQYSRPDRLRRRWWSANDLARVSSWADDIDDLHGAGELVIDDLGSEYLDPKGHYLSRLDALFDARYSGERKTIVTTNLDAVAFAARYGERVYDRLREDATWFSIKGESLRGAE